MRDEWFIRGKVPMTKSEVRTVSLSKLELYEDCEFWDIGAGTGSVSVEAAVSCPGIHVCAFEYKEEAVELIRANCEKARTEAVTIVPGKAPETFAQVSVHRPDRAFIGGTARGIKSGRESYKRERCKECKIRFCTNGGNHGIHIPAGACSHLWGR